MRVSLAIVKAARITIDNRHWSVRYGRPPRDAYGICHTESREIIVARNLTYLERCATGVHEALHAAYPDLEETAIERGESAVMKVLRALDLLREDED